MTERLDWAYESPVEERLIEQLVGLGFAYVPASELDKERESQREVILEDRLRAALQRLNPWLDENNLRKVLREVTHLEAASLMEANEQFHDKVVNYLSVQQDLGKGKKNQTVKIIDFDDPTSNEFVVTNQFRVNTPTGTIIPDIVVFVNGIPLAVIECKSPTITNPQAQAIKQLIRYWEQAERLFHYNLCVIATCNEQSQYATIGARSRHFGEWKDPYPLKIADVGESPTRQDVLVAGMFSKANLLDLLRNFVVYEPEGGRTIKKLARYQQFRATNKAIDRILSAKTPRERGGVVWATQGSGKSITMVYLSVKLRRIEQLENPTIIVVTDRTDLDTQISKTFLRCGFPNPQQAKTVKELRELLQAGSGRTIMTTIQKFEEYVDESGSRVLNEAHNIYALVDESHRTNYGGLAANMRAALPNACFLAFTGTPIDKEDKSTVATFGPYIDKYTIQQAVDDGATVPIFYQGRLTDMHVQGESLDKLFDRMFQEYSEDDRERIKKRYATEEAITGAPQRIRKICMDIIDHYETHIAPNGFKAQIVAINREAAVLYKEILDELNGPESVIIFSGGNDDEDRMKKYHLSKEQQKLYIERFKKPLKEDKLAFLICVDMLLTGFDAPILQAMYLDKPLKEHNLLQAIARTNRTYDGKSYGLIIDYYGVSGFLKQALSIFTDTDVQGALKPIDSELPRLQTRHRSAMRFFDYIRKDDIEACMKVLEPEDVRNEFDVAFKKFAESMDMVMPNPAAIPYREDLKFLGKVRQYAKQRFRDPEMDISDCGEKVKQLIKEHLIAQKIEILHDPVDILSSKFKKKLDEAQSDEAKASEMEHAIKHEIRVKLQENPVYYTSLRERLEQILANYKQRRIDDKEKAEQLQKLIDELRNRSKTIEDEGFEPHEYPFYQLIKQEMWSEYENNDDIKELTRTLLAEIDNLFVIEWTQKEDVKREMRSRLKKKLRISRCDREKVEWLPGEIVKLAEVHFRK
ncbi:type I restriction endonuclease subunit R [Cohnella xylanilytica]|uniref:Type I restriction enzyme endonuclease subunit n=1 Tax=Cohnella xylanilytica TaxID=557555 RepID=A0A841TYV1_9BACL|nr:type I restriction endonuclease subunit R [Cohnella xylanilytica]MBB6691040.1 type I restriction endonuclease subunit R [Cohnella xylanilytica]